MAQNNFSLPARPETDFLNAYSIENFELGPKARRPKAIFLSPARPEPDIFQPDPSLMASKRKGETILCEIGAGNMNLQGSFVPEDKLLLPSSGYAPVK